MTPGREAGAEEAKVSGDALMLCYDNGRRRMGAGSVTQGQRRVQRPRAKVASSQTSSLAVVCSQMDFSTPAAAASSVLHRCEMAAPSLTFRSPSEGPSYATAKPRLSQSQRMTSFLGVELTAQDPNTLRMTSACTDLPPRQR